MSIENLVLIEYKTLSIHKGQISKISFFPSGNFISVSSDKSIIIWDKNLNEFDKIESSHNKYITDIYIVNENNFITSSADLSIKFWEKKNNKFINENKIENISEYTLIKIILINSNLLITCGDNKLKLWKKNKINKKYNLITIISNSTYLNSFIIFLDKDLLIIINEEGTIFYKFSTLTFIKKINNASCGGKNSIKRIDNDRFIVGGREDKIMKIINLNQMRIIKELKNDFFTLGICIINHLNIIITGGYIGNINIFSSINYKKIFYINKAHLQITTGFEYFNNKLFSYSWDKKIKIWDINI